eukprot:1189984-Prorocentrum_minimum.AAC.3
MTIVVAAVELGSNPFDCKVRLVRPPLPPYTIAGNLVSLARIFPKRSAEFGMDFRDLNRLNLTQQTSQDPPSDRATPFTLADPPRPRRKFVVSNHRTRYISVMVCILGNLCRGPLTHSVSIGNPDCQSVRESPQNDPDDDEEYDMTVEEMREFALHCLAAKQAAEDETARLTRAVINQRLRSRPIRGPGFYDPDRSGFDAAGYQLLSVAPGSVAQEGKMAQETLDAQKAAQKAAAENANGSGESH